MEDKKDIDTVEYEQRCTYKLHVILKQAVLIYDIYLAVNKFLTSFKFNIYQTFIQTVSIYIQFPIVFDTKCLCTYLYLAVFKTDNTEMRTNTSYCSDARPAHCFRFWSLYGYTL